LPGLNLHLARPMHHDARIDDPVFRAGPSREGRHHRDPLGIYLQPECKDQPSQAKV
jgi:hypothetical protein